MIPLSVFPSGTLAFFFTFFLHFPKTGANEDQDVFRYDILKSYRAVGEGAMIDEGAEGYQKGLNTALNLLSRRDHFVREMRRKLARKGIPEGAIEQVVAECLRLSYLDDERAALALIDRLKRKGCGRRRLRFELSQRGLSGDRTSALLESRFTPEDESELAWRTLERKWKSYPAGEGETKKRGRIQRFLSGRGFSEASVRAALDRLDSPGRDGRAER
ncbi:MAG: regulatory protein RecX [Desulfobacterales bacterium]|nr:regulatory protein RecX [Desulfobacterales bacterium]